MFHYMTALFFLFGTASATGTESAILVSGLDTQPISPRILVDRIPEGQILIVSEMHEFAPHHTHQVELLRDLNRRSNPITVGFEFFTRDHQTDVDLFLSGKLEEPDFLARVNWGRIPFDFYREQARFGPTTGGTTLALNAPAWITSKVAKSGLESLTSEERQTLPPGFALGNDNYKTRFTEVMKEHVPPESIDRYFAAQSIWDDTMAETACAYHLEHPGQYIFILVGDFHAAHGGGLPDRLRARGCHNVTTISQVIVENLADLDRNQEVAPHPKWGPRADWVWATIAP